MWVFYFAHKLEAFFIYNNLFSSGIIILSYSIFNTACRLTANSKSKKKIRQLFRVDLLRTISDSNSNSNVNVRLFIYCSAHSTALLHSLLNKVIGYKLFYFIFFFLHIEMQSGSHCKASVWRLDCIVDLISRLSFFF